MASSSGPNSGNSSTANSGTSSSSSSGNNFREVYEVTGDSMAALTCLKGQTSPEAEYNRYILQAIGTKNDAAAYLATEGLAQREVALSMEQKTTNKKKQRRDDWIMTYNRGLILLTNGKPLEGIEFVMTKLEPILEAWKSTSATPDTKRKRRLLSSKELTGVACRMAFLVLEGILALSVPRPTHQSSTAFGKAPHYDDILAWLNHVLLDNTSGSDVVDPSLKFQLSLYKGRLDFLHRQDEKLVDAKIRSARKELKHAMEIFQHKLRPPAGNDTMSLASSSALSVGSDNHNGSNNNNNNQGNTSSESEKLGRILQGQNQAALNLKANTEQLKGNVKKSLILLAEAANDDSATTSAVDSNTKNKQAASAASTTASSSYESLHYNNMGIVYNTSGKQHLAQYAWSKALKANNGDNNNTTTSSCFGTDGVAHFNVQLRIHYNAAIGALQVQNYMAAYQCMAICLSEWKEQPRCWLRLAEACIGMRAKMKQENGTSQFLKIEGKEESNGILLQSSNKCWFDPLAISYPVGSAEDLKQLETDPLSRARVSLEIAISLFEKKQQTNHVNNSHSNDEEDDVMGLSHAYLSLSFVCLEQNDYKSALKFAEWILNELPKRNPTSSMDSIRTAMIKRQLATARMYAAEASCALGQATEASKHLVGDGKDDAFDRLASELSGVTIATAAANPLGKTRLAKAQAMVRCSASIAYAELGNLSAAKQLAMSAQAMEDSYSMASPPPRSSNGDGSMLSSARRALVYCNLKEGNTGGAITLMRSAR